MEYNWQFSQKSQCSKDEKYECLGLVSELIALSKVARRNGLLSLVPYAEKNPHFSCARDCSWWSTVSIPRSPGMF